MKKPAMSAALMLLLSCSSPSPKNPRPEGACSIPRLTIPDVAWHTCGAEVCLSVEDSIEVARHFRAVLGTRSALEGCSLVVLTP
jgi:hypothetical protein